MIYNSSYGQGRDGVNGQVIEQHIYFVGQSVEKGETDQVWEAVQKDKEKGGYPWTHLSHPQDEEVWLNPQKLPDDLGR